MHCKQVWKTGAPLRNAVRSSSTTPGTKCPDPHSLHKNVSYTPGKPPMLTLPSESLSAGGYIIVIEVHACEYEWEVGALYNTRGKQLPLNTPSHHIKR